MSETTIEDDTRQHHLSPAMVNALRCVDPDGIMAGGPTRAALMRRGLVIKRGKPAGRFGYLTEAGRELALRLRA